VSPETLEERIRTSMAPATPADNSLPARLITTTSAGIAFPERAMPCLIIRGSFEQHGPSIIRMVIILHLCREENIPEFIDIFVVSSNFGHPMRIVLSLRKSLWKVRVGYRVQSLPQEDELL